MFMERMTKAELTRINERIDAIEECLCDECDRELDALLARLNESIKLAQRDERGMRLIQGGGNTSPSRAQLRLIKGGAV
jgi:hypothetical protein